MNSNNFTEIKINMKHVFLSLLPPTHPTTHAFFSHTNTWWSTPRTNCPAYSSVFDEVQDSELGEPQEVRLKEGQAVPDTT